MKMKKPARKALAELIAATAEEPNPTAATMRDIELWGAAVMNTPSGAERWNAILKMCDTIKASEPQAFDAVAEWIERRLKNGAAVAYFEPFGEWWRQHYNSNSINKAAWYNLIKILEECTAIVPMDAPQRVAIYTALLLQVPTGYTPTEPAAEDTPSKTIKALPAWATSEGAQAIYTAAEDEGLLGRQGDVWKWNGKQYELAFFIYKLNKKLHKGNNVEWAAFEQRFAQGNHKFKVKNLSSIYQTREKKGKNNVGMNNIKNFFQQRR